MKINNVTLAIICATVVLTLGIVAALTYSGKDSTDLLQFLATILVPTVAGLAATNRAEKANKTAQQAVENTNGRMSHLVSIIEALAGEGSVPPEYANVKRIDVNIPSADDTPGRHE